jgi:glycosyltransferase involved in cell wall biosynthesis
VLVFSYRNAPTTAMLGLFRFLKHSKEAGIDVRPMFHGNALIHRSRNTSLAAVRPDADFALMVDDDMMPEPDVLVKLLARDVPVVSAFCTTRVPPVQIAAKRYDEASDQFVPLAALRPDTLVSGPYAVGGAFLLLRRDAIDALKEYYLSANDWLVENRRLFDRLHVRAENREKERARKETIRRANWAREKYLQVFDYPTTENELQLGEDIALSRKLLGLNIPVAIDTAVQVAHLGEYPFGPWDLEGVADAH